VVYVKQTNVSVMKAVNRTQKLHSVTGSKKG
jgi:hypothetical protein